MAALHRLAMLGMTIFLPSGVIADVQNEQVIFKDSFQLPLPSFPLNDTGIYWCGNSDTVALECPLASHPDQDGDFGRDALARTGQLPKIGSGDAGFDFTKLDENGAPLPVDAPLWACVRDNVTNLTWEIKANDPEDLRHKEFTYSWRNPDSSVNGGDPGSINEGNCMGMSCDTHAYVQSINASGLCGTTDWRLPNAEELLSIFHFGVIGTRIDTEYFSDMPSGTISFWSSSALARITGEAWGVNFSTFGGTVARQKSNEGHVRLVRSE
jgi:hypothetical protein